jgi:hypothetical protein
MEAGSMAAGNVESGSVEGAQPGPAASRAGRWAFQVMETRFRHVGNRVALQRPDFLMWKIAYHVVKSVRKLLIYLLKPGLVRTPLQRCFAAKMTNIDGRM